MPFQLALPGCALAQNTEGRWAVTGDAGQVVVSPSPGVLDTLRTLTENAVPEQQVLDQALAAGGYDGLRTIVSSLTALAGAGLLHYSVVMDGRVAVAAVPWGPFPAAGAPEVADADRVVLSAHAFLRRDGSRLQLESPLTRACVHIHDPGVGAIVTALTTPGRVRDACARLSPLDQTFSRAVIDLLAAANMLTTIADHGTPDEADDPALWEFHDLLFHTRSRAGRHHHASGATYRLRGTIDRPPVVKPPMTDQTIALPRPDLAVVAAADPPLTWAIEERRSRRVHGPAPLSLTQIGEFLYRTARVKQIWPLEDSEVSRRPYPAGGASYELEVYLAARDCDGLAPGLYHYDPRAHALEALAADAADVRALLEGAATAAHAPLPQLLVILTARIGRVSWKYSSIAYAVILKDVGVVYQTMYLVATAMGLAGCALGNGDADLFARAAGTGYYDEPSVGEFMLGVGGE